MSRLHPLALVIAVALSACRSAPAAPAPPETRSPGPLSGRALSADGVGVHYRVEGSGSPALVFLHGWSCDGSYWNRQVERFRRRHVVVTLDLAGHGGSAAGRERYTVPAFAEDVRAVVERLDLDRVVLVGHSMGGVVAVEAARRMPERVALIVAVDTLHDAEFEIPPEDLESFLAGLEADFPARAGEFVRGMFPADADAALVERVAADIASAPPDVALSALRGLFAFDLRGALAQITAPIRCLNAAKPPTRVEVNQRYAPRFDAVVIPGVGHFPMLEDAATFNRLLAEAIAALAPSPVAPAGAAGASREGSP